MGFMIGNKTDGAFLAATGYLKIVAVFYVFCFTGNTFAGYFDGIGRVNIPFIGAVGHITLRVILSWIFVSQFQLNAVAVATGIVDTATVGAARRRQKQMYASFV
mgnify:CR=1 FL=1